MIEWLHSWFPCRFPMYSGGLPGAAAIRQEDG